MTQKMRRLKVSDNVETPNGEVESAGQTPPVAGIMDPPVVEGVALTPQEMIDKAHAEAQEVAAEWLRFNQPKEPAVGALAAAYVQALVLCAVCADVEEFRTNLRMNVKGLRRMAWQMWIDMHGPEGTGADKGEVA
jgi:hypothetical protein